jgi:uncharacterized protein (TIGR00251 family)
MDDRFQVTVVDEGLRFAVHVQPRAKKTEVAGVYGNALKVRVAASPVEGAANRALVEFIARQLSVPRHAVEIVSGSTGRQKIVQVRGVTVQQLQARLLVIPGEE